jgi:hypothetical protein
MASLGIAELIVILVIVAFFLVLWSKIYAQAGYSKWLCLLMIVPLVNLIMLIWFAFAKWPVRVELDRLRPNPPTHP